jgi:hypothetical protein
MTEMQWAELIREGRQPEHQARQLLARPLSAWEQATPQVTWRAWALAVLEALDARRVSALSP